MIHTCPQMTWLKKVHTVQVGDIYTSAEEDEQMEMMSKQER